MRLQLDRWRSGGLGPVGRMGRTVGEDMLPTTPPGARVDASSTESVARWPVRTSVGGDPDPSSRLVGRCSSRAAPRYPTVHGGDAPRTLVDTGISRDDADRVVGEHGSDKRVRPMPNPSVPVERHSGPGGTPVVLSGTQTTGPPGIRPEERGGAGLRTVTRLDDRRRARDAGGAGPVWHRARMVAATVARSPRGATAGPCPRPPPAREQCAGRSRFEGGDSRLNPPGRMTAKGRVDLR